MKKRLLFSESLALIICLLFGISTAYAQYQGALRGEFTVNSNGDKVCFSQGNLQYIGSASTPYWKFADHQWESFGTTTNQASTNQNVDRDLFAWGTSGYNHGANCYQPWSYSNSSSDYYAYGNYQYNLFDQTGQADWGYNAISNGGGQTNQWRTLTGPEWLYLINMRPTTSHRYTMGYVNNIGGVILLPDDWDEAYFSLQYNFDTGNGNYFTANQISESDWEILEQHGAVFIPVTGYWLIGYSGVQDSYSMGAYWSATHDTESHSKFFCFGRKSIPTRSEYARNIGCAVRLVRTPVYYSINANPSPTEGGTVSGTGTFLEGTECTLTAKPSSGYAFVNWTENGVVVSTSRFFTFTVEGNRNLVANFELRAGHVGSINGKFTLNANGDQVEFSKGNLQYQASTDTWDFAVHQWDYCGSNNSDISSTTNTWIDLFGWGTSGYHDANDPYNVNYQPWSTSKETVNEDYNKFGYGPSANMPDPLLAGTSANYDWGVYNAIAEGGNSANLWRTPTIEEWGYLFDTRTTSSGIRYAKAIVFSVNGVILLPDDWQTSYYALNSTNDPDAVFGVNNISYSDWQDMEQHGAVFLPVTGKRNGTAVSEIGSAGYYWSATNDYASHAKCLLFAEPVLYASLASDSRYYGYSVRLVRPAQNSSVSIDATSMPAEGGIVRGTHSYVEGSECTLEAFPNIGYIFVNWTENGEVVSTDPEYTFTVTEGRTLVANFQYFVTEGLASGIFSVDENTSVLFSQGNLQYQNSTYTWKFAEHQYDYIGDDFSSDWTDLFAWGASGYAHGAVGFHPNYVSQNNRDYDAYGELNCNLFDQTGQADWGYNAISNGGDHENSGWRTLTIEEWGYLFNGRTTSSDILYAKACVNGVNGVILLPDNWQSSYYSLNSPNTMEADFSTNLITASQWVTLEQHGAVFLPASGHLTFTDGNDNDCGSKGYYWSATCGGPWACCVTFESDDLHDDGLLHKYYHQSVRLVRISQGYAFVNINAAPNPAEGGSVSGGGACIVGSECTLTATPADGYQFVNWTENGNEVSTSASYQFMVTGERTLVANFTSILYPLGALHGEFSVGANSTVFFSQGNLQYIGSASTPYWKFADNQWDYLGTSTGQNSSGQDKDRDLFGWGTSGYNHGANCYYPWSTSVVNSDYYAYGGSTYNLYDQTGLADWGYNAISNGGNQTGHWRTLTQDEWIYLFNTRNTSSGIRYAKACVNGVNGMILLPDNWSTDYYTLSDTNTPGADFSSNVITVSQWTDLEQHGAAFLPAAGSRTALNFVSGESGFYWSAIFSSNNNARCVSFNSSSLVPDRYKTRYYGLSVRLVRSTEDLFYSQEVSVEQGWNWWSTYIEMNGNDGLQQLEASLGHNGLMIKTQTPFVQNYYPSLGYDYWFGSLTSVGLTNETSYQISASSPCEVSVTGEVANASDHPITILPGWNWIGYPMTEQQGLSTALSAFSPTQNDFIKGQTTSATYYGSYGWFPTSFTLTPGQGYMYYSNAGENTTLTYASSRGATVPEAEAEREWHNNAHAHAHNLTLLAVVGIDGEEQRRGDLELGAFVNGDCRGSAALRYFEPTDRWYAMLTVSGEDGETMELAALDRRSGEVISHGATPMTFRADAIVGSLDRPYEACFTDADMLVVYPNPTECNSSFTLDLPEGEMATEVVVYNALGETVLHETSLATSTTIRSPKVSGVYFVKVVCKSGAVYSGRIIVR